MRWFLDTEFDENGTTIKLISIALVAESGQYFYAVAADGWREEDCDPWVRENVVAKLPPKHTWVSRDAIKSAVVHMLLREHSHPEIWGYFSDYDWVVFCQLFGKMIDLPKGMPMFCFDLKQEMWRRGFRKQDLPQQDESSAHDALADARWIRDAWLYMRSKA